MGICLLTGCPCDTVCGCDELGCDGNCMSCSYYEEDDE